MIPFRAVRTGQPSGLLPRAALALLLCLAVGRVSTALAQPEHPTAEAAFADAFGLYAHQLYAQALRGLQDFRDTYPDHINAPEALYYQAESALALDQEDEAVRLFKLFQQQYPAHPLAFQARLALGKYFYESGAHERAIETLTAVLAEGPPPELAAKALYWMGESALQVNRPDEALGYFRRAADNYRTTTTAPVALYAVAFTLVEEGRYDEAARAFEQLAARYPGSSYAQNVGLALAEVYYELGDHNRTVSEIQLRLPVLSDEAQERATFLLAESYNRLRDSENAILSYRRFTEGNPNSPYYRPALYGLAWHYYQEGVYEWAAEQFGRAAAGQTDELAAKATYYEGVNLKLLQQPMQAIERFEAFMQQWPTHELAHYALYELGIAYYEQRMWSEANAAFTELIQAYPESSLIGDAQYFKGNTFIALGEFDQALTSFDQAIAFDAAPASLKDEVNFQKAWLLYRNARYEEAAPAFLSLYRARPQGERSGEALFWAAESFFQLGRLEEAEDLFKVYLREVRGGKQSEAVHYALGWVYFKQARYAEAARSFEQFLSAYRERNEQVPYRTDALLRLADSYYALKRYPEAIRNYQQVASQGEEYALYQIGQAFTNAGDAFEAITAFRRLLSEYPDSEWREEAQYQLGYLYFLNQDYDQAAAAYRRIIETAPRDPLAAKAQYGIGDALFNAGRMEDAIQAYQEVLERYPQSPFAADAASSIQYALIAEGDERRAERLIQEFAQRNPDSPVVDELRFRQAEVKYQSGRIDEALDDFRTFIRSSRNADLLAQAYYYQGLIHADRNQFEEAEQALRRLTETYQQSPRRPAALQRLGALYLEQGRHRDALEQYRRLGEARTGDALLAAEARYGQGLALLGLGRANEAEQLLRAAVEAAPDSPNVIPAMMGLARVYEETSRVDEGARIYRQIIARSRDERGAEALYRLGTLLLRRGDARAAIEELSRMPVLYAGFPNWVAQGYLAQARAFRSLGRRGDAARLYDRVINDFSDLPLAEIAEQEKAAL